MRLVLGWVLLWGAADPPPPPVDSVCHCAEVRGQTAGWCGTCGTGFVAGVEVPSALLFEALDAHGHEIDPTSIRCEECQRALESDAYCPRSGMGFVAKQAYFSRLTWVLARGRIPESHASRSHSHVTEPPLWCEACAVGQVGPVEFREQAHFEIAVQEVHLLRRAVAQLETCEICAVALFTGSKCPRCRISWRCECPKERERGGWCRRCEKGHLVGFEIPSRKLYEGALAGPLGKGKRRQGKRRQGKRRQGKPGEVVNECQACAVKESPAFWCDACESGRVADLRFEKNSSWQQAVKAREDLRAALELLPRCEACAVSRLGTGVPCRDCAKKTEDTGRLKQRAGQR